MAKHPGLMRRGMRWYLRTRVPVDLIETIGRREIQRSLETGDHREAVRRYHVVKAELDAWFDQQRRRAAGLRSDEARRLASTWLRETDHLNAHADFALIGPDRRIALAETAQDVAELIKGADGESVQAVVDRLLIDAGWPARQHTIGSIRTRRQVADVDPADIAELSALVRRGLIELSRRRLSRLNGQPIVGLDPIFVRWLHPRQTRLMLRRPQHLMIARLGIGRASVYRLLGSAA